MPLALPTLEKRTPPGPGGTEALAEALIVNRATDTTLRQLFSRIASRISCRHTSWRSQHVERGTGGADSEPWVEAIPREKQANRLRFMAFQDGEKWLDASEPIGATGLS